MSSVPPNRAGESTPLLPRHRERLERDSAIAPDVLAERGCRSVTAAARPATPTGIPIETWLEYGQLGIPIVPEHTPDPTSPTRCDCRDPKCSKPGKHPRTRNGSLDATTDRATLERWHRTWPHANTGTALEMADLVIIGPDSPEWAEEFARRGLPPTAVAQSGGGEGHLHYYYRRRPCCPTARICKPGEYDLLANGNAILPPSLHISGAYYTWLVPIESLDQLPYAPAWLCAELHPVGVRGRDQDTYRGGDEDGPPVVLDDYGLKVWRGELPRRKPDGEVDRSGTLLKIGRALYDAGAARRLNVTELAERDETLGYRKFTDRPDRGTRYHAIVDELERQGRTPRFVIDPPAPNGHTNGQANGAAAAEVPEAGHDGAEGCLPCAGKDAEIVRLQRLLLEREDTIESQQHIIRAQRAQNQQLEAQAAERSRLEAAERKLRQVKTFTGNQKAAIVATARIATSAASRGNGAPIITRAAVAEETGCHEATAGAALKVFDLPGSPIERDADYILQTDADGVPLRKKIIQYRIETTSPAEIIEAMIDVGRCLETRQRRYQGPVCPNHPDAGTETRTVVSCAACGLALNERTSGHAPPTPIVGEDQSRCERLARIGETPPPVETVTIQERVARIVGPSPNGHAPLNGHAPAAATLPRAPAPEPPWLRDVDYATRERWRREQASAPDDTEGLLL